MQSVVLGELFSTASTSSLYTPLCGGNALTLANIANGGQAPAPFAGSISNLTAHMDTPIGGSDSRTFTFVVNGVDTALTTTLTGAQTSNSDTTHTVSFNAGDLLSIHTSATASTATGKIRFYTLVRGTKNQSLAFAAASATFNNTVTNWLNIQGGGAATTASLVTATSIMPTAGTFKNLYLALSVAPASGTVTVTLYKNGSSTGLTVTITGNGSIKTANDTAHTVSVSPGDTVVWQLDPTSTPTVGRWMIGVEFDPTIDGESLQLAKNAGSNNTVTRWNAVSGLLASDTATESNTTYISPVCVWQKLYVLANTAPGAGKTRPFQFSVNATPGNPTCTITDTNTTANDTTNTRTTADKDLVTLKQVPTGAPAGSLMAVSMVTFIKPSSGGGQFFSLVK